MREDLHAKEVIPMSFVLIFLKTLKQMFTNDKI